MKINLKPENLTDAISELCHAVWSIVNNTDKPGAYRACFDLAKIDVEAIYELTKAPPNIIGIDKAIWCVELRKAADAACEAMDIAHSNLFHARTLTEESTRGQRLSASQGKRDAKAILREAIEPLTEKLRDLAVCDGIENHGLESARATFKAWGDAIRALGQSEEFHKIINANKDAMSDAINADIEAFMLSPEGKEARAKSDANERLLDQIFKHADYPKPETTQEWETLAALLGVMPRPDESHGMLDYMNVIVAELTRRHGSPNLKKQSGMVSASIPRAESNGRKATVNARMVDVLGKEPESAGWKARQWAARLKCSDAAVVKTNVWKSMQLDKDKEKADQASKRAREKRRK